MIEAAIVSFGLLAMICGNMIANHIYDDDGW